MVSLGTMLSTRLRVIRSTLKWLLGVPNEEEHERVPVHRPITNFIPLNRICRPINENVSTLPAWPSMHPSELGEGESLLVTSEEDVRCFFYIFTVPEARHRYILGFCETGAIKHCP